MGFILYIFARFFGVILDLFFMPLTFAYYLFTFRFKKSFRLIERYFYHLAFSFDQFANVRYKVWLNKFMAEKYKRTFYYGDEDDTISYCTAMNYYKNKNEAKGLLKFVAIMLDKVDKNHLEKAIKNKIKRDFEALKRLEKTNIVFVDYNNVSKNDWKKYVQSITNKKRKV